MHALATSLQWQNASHNIYCDIIKESLCMNRKRCRHRFLGLRLAEITALCSKIPIFGGQIPSRSLWQMASTRLPGGQHPVAEVEAQGGEAQERKGEDVEQRHVRSHKCRRHAQLVDDLVAVDVDVQLDAAELR
eukprot:scaffold100566_cov36-Prasinocladus_malaysianus.AAC.1